MFEELSLKLDDYRDGVSRKLNELHMSLQRPKVPMNLPTPAMMYNPKAGRQLEENTDVI